MAIRLNKNVAQTRIFTGTPTFQIAGNLVSEEDDFTIRPPRSTVPLTLLRGGNLVSHALRDFILTTPANDTKATSTINGVRINEAGVYDVLVQISLQFSASATGQWGVSLRRVTRDGNGNETVVREATFSAHVERTAAAETLIESLSLPAENFDNGDLLYLEVFYNSVNAGDNFTFLVSPSPNVSHLWLNRLKGDGIQGEVSGWAEQNNDMPIPAEKLINAPGGRGLDETEVEAKINELRPNAFTDADEEKLDGITAGAEPNVNADWEAATGDAEILNKPNLADVATSGRYADLTGTPNIPTPRTNQEIDNRIEPAAREGSSDRWTKDKLPVDTAYDDDIPTTTEIDARIGARFRAGDTGRIAKSKLPSDVIYTSTQRFTTTLLAKLNALPEASAIQFENHAVADAAALNALSRTTTSLDFVTVTANITTGITANTVTDADGTALTSLNEGDFLILDHSDNVWRKVGNFVTSATVDQTTVRGFITAEYVRGLLANLSGNNRLQAAAIRGLADVATSGSYADLSNQPTLSSLGGVTSAQATSLAEAAALSRYTAAEKTKLGNVADGAEVNVNADWDATSGDAQILNKPTIPTLPNAATKAEAEAGTETALRGFSPLRIKEAIDALKGSAAPGTTRSSFVVSKRPDAAVTLATGATAGVWTSWTTIATTAALGAAQAGKVIVAGEVTVEVTDDTTSGGDRGLAQMRLVRTRGSVDTPLTTQFIYGPRNVGQGVVASFEDASQMASGTAIWEDDAQGADTYKLEARVMSQMPTLNVSFNTANNGILVSSVGGISGGGGGGLTAAQVRDLIADPAEEGSSDRWGKNKLPSDTIYTATQRFTTALLSKLNGIANNATRTVSLAWSAVTGKPATATRWPTYAEVTGKPTDLVTTSTQRFTTTLLAKLNALPSAASIQFENHPVGTAAALNALSRTTQALDFVSITAAIASGITANTVVDGSGTALTTLAAGDLLVLDHDDNRWVRIVNLPTTATVSQSTVRGFIDGAFVVGLLTALSGNARLSYSSLRDVPATVTKAEAEAGTETGTRIWTPQRVKEAIDALAPDSASEISVDASGFDGNLATTDNDVQKALQKLDDLEVGSGGGSARSFFINTKVTSTVRGTVPSTGSLALTVLTSPAITSAQAGNVLLVAALKMFSTIVGSVAGGVSLIRTRSSVDTVIGETYLSLNRDSSSSFFGSVDVATGDLAQTGDVYKMQVSLQARNASNRRVTTTIQFNTNRGNYLIITPC